ncbi:MAG TPA: superoxide dismutase family protein [Polyangiaceae bacterium]|nr:superoxide dismutase family protein [Polyangiaceae bacterium]
MKSTNYWIVLTSSAVLCLACDKNQPTRNNDDPLATNNSLNGESDKHTGAGHDDKDKAHVQATATIQGAEGVQIGGEAWFTDDGDGVKVVVDVKDAPVGEKGIHIHEVGDCSNIRGASMGSHFSPEGNHHGMPGMMMQDVHLGDLGNIKIKDDGTGKKEITVKKANLKEGDAHSLLGKSIVIHQDEDKGASEQPSGGSGTPIACGVIQKS